MDPITGSMATNSVFMTGNNNINTSNDVMASRNMANETAVAQGGSQNAATNQDVMASRNTQDTTAMSVAAASPANADNGANSANLNANAPGVDYQAVGNINTTA